MTYDPIRTARTKSGACPACGKRTKRTQTFQQTLNPYNRNSNGEMKTVREILLELEQQANEWEPDFRHDRCKETA